MAVFECNCIAKTEKESGTFMLPDSLQIAIKRPGTNLSFLGAKAASLGSGVSSLRQLTLESFQASSEAEKGLDSPNGSFWAPK